MMEKYNVNINETDSYIPFKEFTKKTEEKH